MAMCLRLGANGSPRAKWIVSPNFGRHGATVAPRCICTSGLYLGPGFRDDDLLRT